MDAAGRSGATDGGAQEFENLLVEQLEQQRHQHPPRSPMSVGVWSVESCEPPPLMISAMEASARVERERVEQQQQQQQQTTGAEPPRKTTFLAGTKHALLLTAMAAACIVAPSYTTAVYLLLFLLGSLLHQVLVVDRSYRAPYAAVLALALTVSTLHILGIAVVNITATVNRKEWDHWYVGREGLFKGFGLWVESSHGGDTTELISAVIPSIAVLLTSILWVVTSIAPGDCPHGRYGSHTLMRNPCDAAGGDLSDAASMEEVGSYSADVTPGLTSVLIAVQTSLAAAACVLWPKVITVPYFILFVVLAFCWARGGPSWHHSATFQSVNVAVMAFCGVSIVVQFLFQLAPLSAVADDVAADKWIGVIRTTVEADVTDGTRWRFYGYLCCIYAFYFVQAVRMVPIHHLVPVHAEALRGVRSMLSRSGASRPSFVLRPFGNVVYTLLKQQALNALFICLGAAAMVSVSILSGVWLIVMLFFMWSGVNLRIALAWCALHCLVVFISNIGLPDARATNVIGLTETGNGLATFAALACLLLIIAAANRFYPTKTEPLGQQIARYVRRFKSFYVLALFCTVVVGCNMVDAVHSVLIVLFFFFSLCSAHVRRRFWPMLVAYQVLLGLFLYNYNVVCMRLGEPSGMEIVVDHPFGTMWELLPYLLAILLSIVQMFIYRAAEGRERQFDRAQGFKTRDEAAVVIHLKLFALRTVCFCVFLVLPPSVMTCCYFFLSVCLTWIPAIDRIDGTFIKVFIATVLTISILSFLSLYLFQFDQLDGLHSVLCDGANFLLGCPLTSDDPGNATVTATTTPTAFDADADFDATGLLGAARGFGLLGGSGNSKDPTHNVAHDRSPCVEQFGLWYYNGDSERTIGLLFHWSVLAVGVSLLGDLAALKTLLARQASRDDADGRGSHDDASPARPLLHAQHRHHHRHAGSGLRALYRGVATVGETLNSLYRSLRPTIVIFSQYFLLIGLFLASSDSKSLPSVGYFVLLMVALLTRRRRVIYVAALAYSTLCISARLLFQFKFFPGGAHLADRWRGYLDLRNLGTSWTCEGFGADAPQCDAYSGCSFDAGAHQCHGESWTRQLFLMVPYVWTDVFVLYAAKLCLRCIEWIRPHRPTGVTYDSFVAAMTCFNHKNHEGPPENERSRRASNAGGIDADGMTADDIMRIVRVQAHARRMIARRRCCSTRMVSKTYKEGVKIHVHHGVIFRVRRADYIEVCTDGTEVVHDVRHLINAHLDDGGLRLRVSELNLDEHHLPANSHGASVNGRADASLGMSQAPSSPTSPGWWRTVFSRKSANRLEVDYIPRLHAKDIKPGLLGTCRAQVKALYNRFRWEDVYSAGEVVWGWFTKAVDFGFATYSLELTVFAMLLMAITHTTRADGLCYFAACAVVCASGREVARYYRLAIVAVAVIYCVREGLYVGLPEGVAWGPFPDIGTGRGADYYRYLGAGPSRGDLFVSCFALGLLVAHRRAVMRYTSTRYYDAANAARFGYPSLTQFLDGNTKQVRDTSFTVRNWLRILHGNGRLTTMSERMLGHLLPAPEGLKDVIRNPEGIMDTVMGLWYYWLPVMCMAMVFYDSCVDAFITLLRMGKLGLGIYFALRMDRVLDSDRYAKTILCYYFFCSAVHVVWNLPFLAQLIDHMGGVQDVLLFFGVMRCRDQSVYDRSASFGSFCPSPELIQFDASDAACIYLLFLHRLHCASWRYIYVIYQWHGEMLLAEKRREIVGQIFSEKQQRYDDMTVLMEWEMNKARQRALEELEDTHRILNAYPLTQNQEANEDNCYLFDSGFDLRAVHDSPGLSADERQKRRELREVFLDGWWRKEPPASCDDCTGSWYRKVRKYYEYGMSGLVRLPVDLTGRPQEDNAFLCGLLEGPSAADDTDGDDAVQGNTAGNGADDTTAARTRRAYLRGKRAAAPGGDETDHLLALAGAFAAFATFYKQTPITAKLALALNQRTVLSPLVGVWTVYDVHHRPWQCLRDSLTVFFVQNTDVLCYLIFTFNFCISACVLDMLPSLASYLYALLAKSHPRAFWRGVQIFMVALLALKCAVQVVALSFGVSLVNLPWLFGRLTTDSFFSNAFGDFISIVAIKYREKVLRDWGSWEGGSEDEAQKHAEENGDHKHTALTPSQSSRDSRASVSGGSRSMGDGGWSVTSAPEELARDAAATAAADDTREMHTPTPLHAPEPPPTGAPLVEVLNADEEAPRRAPAAPAPVGAATVRFGALSAYSAATSGSSSTSSVRSESPNGADVSPSRGADGGGYFEKAFQGVSDFINGVVREDQKDIWPRDFYLSCVTLDLFGLLFYILLFSYLTGGSGLVLLSALQENLLPGMLVLGMLVLVLCMLADRICYLTADIRAKYIHHVVVVLLAHITLFVWAQTLEGMPASAHAAGSVIFMLRGLYFIVSAKQLKHSYPKFRYDCFQGSSSSNVSILYDVFRGIPFLYEMRILLDWACSDTTLDREMWLKLEGVRTEMFVRRVQIDLSTEAQPKAGDKFPPAYKIGSGWLFVVLMLLLVFFPLGFYSTFSPALQLNSVKAVDVEIAIDGSPPLYRNMISLDDSQIFKDQDLAVELSKTRSSMQKARITGSEENLQLLTFTPFSNQRWPITIAAVQDMVANLQNLSTPAPALLVTVSVTRTLAPLGQETLQSTSRFPLNSKNATMRRELADLLNWDGNSTEAPARVELKHFYTPIVFNKADSLLFSGHRADCVLSASSGRATDGVQKFYTMECLGLFSCGNDVRRGDPEFGCITDRSACPDYDTEDPIPCPLPNATGTVPFYYAFISDVASDKNSLLSGLFDVGIVALYVTVVLNVNTLLRGMLTRSGVVAFIQDMRDPTFVSDLADYVHLARWLEKPELEQEMYLLLINLLRSPETLMRITGLRKPPIAAGKRRKRIPRKREGVARSGFEDGGNSGGGGGGGGGGAPPSAAASTRTPTSTTGTRNTAIPRLAHSASSIPDNDLLYASALMFTPPEGTAPTSVQASASLATPKELPEATYPTAE